MVVISGFVLLPGKGPAARRVVLRARRVWMAVPHIGLLGSAADGIVQWPAALNMFVRSLATLLCAAGLATVAWKHLDEPQG